MSNDKTFNAVISFALTGEDGLTWLRLWNEGEFDKCRKEWPEAPAECYEGQVFSAAYEFNLSDHLIRQKAFSEKTFGPGPRTKGITEHIRKELAEIEAAPGDLGEWVDVILLALDGAWRCGGTPTQIIEGIVAKQTKNENRTWPDWRLYGQDKAVEHDRSGEQKYIDNMQRTEKFFGKQLPIEVLGAQAFPWSAQQQSFAEFFAATKNALSKFNLRPIISNAIYSCGEQLEDHQSAVESIAKAIENSKMLKYGVTDEYINSMNNSFKASKLPIGTFSLPLGEVPATQFPSRDPSKPAEEQGLFDKFTVKRNDGSDAPGRKHFGCRYFVLDLDHDPHAAAAMKAYAESCRATHPKLAEDIEKARK